MDRQIEVDDGAAAVADEVAVVPGGGVEALGAVLERPPEQPPLLGQYPQVPVDVPQADIGRFPAKPVVYTQGGGMGLVIGHYPPDALPLGASPPGWQFISNHYYY